MTFRTGPALGRPLLTGHVVGRAHTTAFEITAVDAYDDETAL
ncbi:hypothetical protein [Sinomonas atrocyanea]|nr:hypothetical protein [Sinomonas atrocyanea]MDQ0261597.1 hypothetical protein [Sinomonas atrocyanea]MDR6621544.1 hypothetical protein [Sinomonas atrocyanea]